jgi:hypothetical protein
MRPILWAIIAVIVFVVVQVVLAFIKHRDIYDRIKANRR